MSRFISFVLPLSCLLPGALATGIAARARSGMLAPPSAPLLARRSWNSQAVGATQIRSPAEVEEEEESAQELPQPGAASPAFLDYASMELPAALSHSHQDKKTALLALSEETGETNPARKLPFTAKDPAAQAAPAVHRDEELQGALAAFESYLPAPVLAAKFPVATAALPVLPPPMQRMRANGTAQFAATIGKDPEDLSFYKSEQRTSCHPPCISDRGVCNDNVCYCRTPYTGTTCQNEVVVEIWRAGPGVVIVVAVASLALGILVSMGVYSFVRERIEQQTSVIGESMVNKEFWTPSLTGGKKLKPGGRK